MDIFFVDYLANFKKSFMHSAPISLKFSLTAVFIAGAVVFQDVFWLLLWYSTVLIIIYVADLPFEKIFYLSLYPLLFTIIFVISYSFNVSFLAVIILKVLTAASAMLLLITTTPYTKIFAALQKTMPQVVVSALFFTYRSIFILFSILEDLRINLSLRGGVSIKYPIRTLGNIADSLGVLLIRGISMSERTFEVMKLKGFSGKFHYSQEDRQIQPSDIVFSILILFLSSLFIYSVTSRYL